MQMYPDGSGDPPQTLSHSHDPNSVTRVPVTQYKRTYTTLLEHWELVRYEEMSPCGA